MVIFVHTKASLNVYAGAQRQIEQERETIEPSKVPLQREREREREREKKLKCESTKISRTHTRIHTQASSVKVKGANKDTYNSSTHQCTKSSNGPSLTLMGKSISSLLHKETLSLLLSLSLSLKHGKSF